VIFAKRGVQLFLFRPLIGPIKFFSKKIFRWFLVPSYKFYLKAKNFLVKTAGLNQITKLYLITHKKTANVTIVLIALFTIFTNWQVGEIRAEAGFGKNILLAQIVDTSELGTLVEQKAENIQPQVASYIDTEGFSEEPILGTDDINFEEEAREGIFDTTQDESVIIKPDLPVSEISNINSGETSIKRNKEVIYYVQENDNLGSIARNFGLKVSTLLWNNNLTSRSIIRPGDKLIIPPLDGIIHTVSKNETLLSIVKKYEADLDLVINQNNLVDANDVTVGQKLFIPGGIIKVVIPPKPKVKKSIVNLIIPDSAQIVSSEKLLWPTDTKRVTQYYNWRHSGLDIARKGENVPIYAAEDGTVSLAKSVGYNGGYGRYIILNHSGGMQTLYGHLEKLYVSVGETVTKGQVIGIMGNTGRSTGQHLHFETRYGRTRVNPLKYVK
jgi:LysM repeat protein